MLSPLASSPLHGGTAMASLIPFLLAIHVAAGTLALIVAPAAMLPAKGGAAHRRWGRIYYRAMAMVALTAVVVALWRPDPFLAMVAVFSYYFAFTGRRILLHKRPDRGERASRLDWGAAGVAAATSAGLVVLGIVRPGEVWARLGVVAVVFGVVGLA